MAATWHSLIDWTALPGLFTDADDWNEQLRDNQEWLKSRPFSTAVIASTTTTSTTFVELTGSSTALVSIGGNVMIVANGTSSNASIANTFYDLAIDGTRVGDSVNGMTFMANHVANYKDCVGLAWFTSTPPSATSHNYSIHWKTSTGTATGLFSIYIVELR